MIFCLSLAAVVIPPLTSRRGGAYSDEQFHTSVLYVCMCVTTLQRCGGGPVVFDQFVAVVCTAGRHWRKGEDDQWVIYSVTGARVVVRLSGLSDANYRRAGIACCRRRTEAAHQSAVESFRQTRHLLYGQCHIAAWVQDQPGHGYLCSGLLCGFIIVRSSVVDR